MNQNAASGNSFSSLLNAIPSHVFAIQSQEALAAVCQDIDRLGLIDPHTNEVYLSETQVRELLQRAGPTHAVEGVIHRLRARPDQRLLNDQEARRKGATPIGMLDLISRVEIFSPPSNPTYASLGLDVNSTEADAPAKMKNHFPDMPDIWFDTQRLRSALLDALNSQSAFATREAIMPDAGSCDFWSCIWRVLPFWVAAAIITTLGLIIAATGGAAALVIAAIIALGYGGATATAIGNCLINPCE